MQEVKALLQQTPGTLGASAAYLLDDTTLPNYVGLRRAAQLLHLAALYDLHKGNLAGALDSLVALAVAAQTHRNEPHVVSQMIRVAVVWLGVDITWAALQSPGWTEPQLAALQRAWERVVILPQLERTFTFERAANLYRYERFRQSAYEPWVNRYRPLYASLGAKLPHSASASVCFWRQWLFHPLWSFAWADQEELFQAKQSQLDLEAIREAVRYPNWAELHQRLTANHDRFHPPRANWRFYGGVPMSDESNLVFSGPGTAPTPKRLPLPEAVDDWVKLFASLAVKETPAFYEKRIMAWRTTFRNLTEAQLMLSAIALKRYSLRHGKDAPTLQALVPEFLSAQPRDLMDGQPLRYHLNPDGTYLLYSVGDDGKDDGGKGVDPEGKLATPVMWQGLDLVWPQAVRTPEPYLSLHLEPEGGDVAPLGLLVFDDAPVLAAITALARQANKNVFFAPEVLARYDAPGAKPISGRWTNATVREVLEQILPAHGLRVLHAAGQTDRIVLAPP